MSVTQDHDQHQAETRNSLCKSLDVYKPCFSAKKDVIVFRTACMRRCVFCVCGLDWAVSVPESVSF